MHPGSAGVDKSGLSAVFLKEFFADFAQVFENSGGSLVGTRVIHNYIDHFAACKSQIVMRIRDRVKDGDDFCTSELLGLCSSMRQAVDRVFGLNVAESQLALTQFSLWLQE